MKFGAFIFLIVSSHLCAQELTDNYYNAHIQFTYISTWKSHFSNPYENENSLKNKGDLSRSYTGTVTGYLGIKPFQNTEIYLNPEAFIGTPFSNLKGMGGFPNGELQKGTEIPAIYYPARFFIRQTFNLGGDKILLEDAANQIAGEVDSNRIAITYGVFSLADYFDQNSYSHDPRTQFLNWSLMASAAYDYAADTRGYTYGVMAEYFDEASTIRFAHTAMPTSPNTIDLDNSLSKDYGDQIEVTHNHIFNNQPGKLRILLFRNHGLMGNYNDATTDITTVRKYVNKQGYAFNLEQAIAKDIGAFARWSWNDGRTETEAFTDVSRSLSFGLVIKGNRWSRDQDTVGFGFAINGIAQPEIDYLKRGGMSPFLGDGNINYQPERIFETYYSFNLYKGLTSTVDYQHAINPGYNQDRGPVDYIGVRFHFEI
jgi:high affinity Mn2+ porin